MLQKNLYGQNGLHGEIARWEGEREQEPALVAVAKELQPIMIISVVNIALL